MTAVPGSRTLPDGGPLLAAQVAGSGFHSGSGAAGVPRPKWVPYGWNPVSWIRKTGFADEGHSGYFVKGSTPAANVQSVIEGGRVSLYVDEVLHYGFGYSCRESPIEDRPEDYTAGKLQTVTTESLEK